MNKNSDKLLFIFIFLFFFLAITGCATTTKQAGKNEINETISVAAQRNKNQTAYPEQKPGDKKYSVLVGKLKRTYSVHVPGGYDYKKPTPVLLAFHGFLGLGENMRKLTSNGFDSLSDERNFLVVYPDGYKRSWNVLQGNLPSVKENIDDIGFIRNLIADLRKAFNVDNQMIFAAGISNGAYFSYRLGCEMGEVIRGVAAVAGPFPVLLSQSCKQSSPLPFLIIQGTDDPLALSAGGKSSAGIEILSADESIRFFAEKNSCSTEPIFSEEPAQTKDSFTVSKISYAKCDRGSDVVLYKIMGAGHTWPGGWQYFPEKLVGKTAKDFNACRVIWNFFEKQAEKNKL